MAGGNLYTLGQIIKLRTLILTSLPKLNPFSPYLLHPNPPYSQMRAAELLIVSEDQARQGQSFVTHSPVHLFYTSLT